MTIAIDEISPDTPRSLTLEFRGNAREYFRLWVVNLCLTLCSFGIYSAWAKVRKQRYLHSHTVLDGTPFQYLGRPLTILKGRLVAAFFLAAYYLVSYLSPALKPFVLASAVVVAPWVLVRSAAFNARNTAYRNMRFDFTASYSAAAGVLYWLGAVPALVVGLIFEWWDDPRIMGAAFGLAGLLFPFWLGRFKRLMVTQRSFGGQAGVLDARATAFFRIYFLGGLILAGVGTVVTVLMKFSPLSGRLSILLAPASFYAAYMVSLAYVRSQSANLVWNHLRVGPLRFRSSLKTWPLLKLYVGNTAGILLSCGLLVPWAVIRTLRYRLAHLQPEVTGSLAQFRAPRTAGATAGAAELSDLLQLDLAL